MNRLLFAIITPMLALAAAACASQEQPEPETPASQPTSADEGGEHTMPDGTEMQGHQHGGTGTHTMPDGTVMEGDSHNHSTGGEE